MQRTGAEFVCHRVNVRSQRRRLSGFEEQNGGADVVANSGGGGAEEDVGEQAVAVGAHRNEVAAFLLDPFDDLAGGLAEGEFGLSRDSGGLEFGADFFQVGGVFGDLGTDCIRTIGAGRPIRPRRGGERAGYALV